MTPALNSIAKAIGASELRERAGLDKDTTGDGACSSEDKVQTVRMALRTPQLQVALGIDVQNKLSSNARHGHRRVRFKSQLKCLRAVRVHENVRPTRQLDAVPDGA